MAEAMLSAVVTSYKDEQAIPLMHARLSRVFEGIGVAYEIIFVNDGSPDDADSVLRELSARDPHVIAVEHSRNFGSQNAFVSGMQLASGDAVILLDGDLQDPPELIAEFYARWRQGYDVVYGQRRRREGSPCLALCCWLFYRIFRQLSSVPMPLDAGDFGLMDRKVVTELLALPEADQFLRGLRAWVGFKQIGVQYVRPPRRFGRSTHTRLANVWWAKKAIFSFSFAPLEVIGYAALGLTTASVFGGIYQVIDVVRHPESPHGFSSIVVLIAFFGSLNLLALATLAEYLIKIFEEVKRRPRFIRKAIQYRGQTFAGSAAMAEFLRLRQPSSTSSARSGVRDDG